MKKDFRYDIQKIINNHNISKALRYKWNIFDIKNINENNKLEIPYKNQKYDKTFNIYEFYKKYRYISPYDGY